LVLTNADVPDLMTSPPYNYVLEKEPWEEGDPVAAVVAEEEDIAEEAIALIDVQYEVLPFILYAKEGAKAGAPIMHGTTNELGAPWIYKRGDATAGLAQSEVPVVEQEYTCVYKPWSGERPVAPVEGESIAAVWEHGRLTVWASTQNPHGDVRSIAAQLGLPYSKVVMNHTYAGVGFGNKGGDFRAKILVSWAAMKTNRPVKCMESAEQSFNSNNSSHSEQNRTIKVGVKKDGTITAYHEINWQASGCWGGRGSNDASMPLQYMYDLKNLYAEGHDIFTNTPGTGVPRCVQHPEATFQQQLHMDRVAEAINMDPADFLQKICFKGQGVGGHPDFPLWDMGTNPIPEMLKKLVEISGWKTKWKGWKTPVVIKGSKRTGIGIALHVCRHGAMTSPASAMIKANTDGSFSISCGSQDVGTGYRTAAAIQAAEELGVSYDKVVTSRYDTDSTQESSSTGGSKVCRASGTAIILAARDLKRQIFEMAIAGKLIAATKPEELESADDYIYLKATPATRIKMADVCSRMQSIYVPNSTSSTTFGSPLIGRGSYATKRDRYAHMNWSCCVAEVEVDTDTGEYKVLDLYVVHDAGRVIWLQGAVNQAWGAFALAQGLATVEGLIKDEATGITLNPNYLDYKVPTLADIPDYHLEWNEAVDPYGPWGCKGIAEPLLGPPAPAIVNAISHAVGARFNSPMIQPDKILAAMGKG
jgi:CO/xanthine dehydrogenase Mo-binding subunit